MIPTNIFSRLVTLLFFISICFSISSFLKAEFRNIYHDKLNAERARGCTVFTLVKGDKVFFGGNDDYINPDSYYWVDPGNGKRYGVIWVGEPDNVQQGINEKGLAYDANGLPRVDVNSHPEREAVHGGYTSYPMQMMYDCASVVEIIEWVNTHQWHTFMHDQMQFADASGDAVIISAGADGEAVFTRKPAGDSYIVSTNYNVANPANGFGYPCWRYDRASEMMSLMVEGERELTIEDARDVLDAVHVEGGSSWTISSLAADLKKGKVYLYYFYQFDHPIILDVKSELANPREAGPISTLFPAEIQEEASRRYEHIQSMSSRCLKLGIIWIGLTTISLLFFFFLSKKQSTGLHFWIPAIFFLGFPAFLMWIFLRSGREKKNWQLALVEGTGDLIPAQFTFFVSLVILLVFPFIQASWIMQLFIYFLLPILLGLLLFHGPMLSRHRSPIPNNSFWQRLPHVWLTMNMGLGGMSVLVVPLVDKAVKSCSIFPFSFGTVLTFWAISGIATIIGFIFIQIYEMWNIKRGNLAWNLAAGEEGNYATPPWRQCWWWIPISFIFLIVGFACGAMLSKIF